MCDASGKRTAELQGVEYGMEEAMDITKIVFLLHQYRRAQSMIDPLRYSCTIPAIQHSGGIFGMNFEQLFSLPPEQQADWFLTQQRQAELLRRLIAGEQVEERELMEQFHCTETELAGQTARYTPLRKGIPDKLVVLNFDDAIRDQYEVAVPLLQKYGFHATFFLAEIQSSPRGPGFEDKGRYMTWEQIGELERMGYELGNHTKHHRFGLQDMGRDAFVGEVLAMEDTFAAHGLAKPVSFAYPSGIANRDAVGFVRECGYLWARGNCENGVCGMRGMSTYVPEVDTPLAMPNFGDPDFYSEALLRDRIALARDGHILGLTYHSVSPESWPGPCSFARQMEILAEEGCKVISVAELSEYVDPRAADAMNPA